MLKKKLLALSATCLVATVGTQAYAFSDTHSSAIEIVKPIRLAEVLDMRFGRVSVPKDQQRTVTVATNGVVTGDADMLPSDRTPSVFLVDIAQNTNFIVNVESTSTEAGLTLSDFTLRYQGDTAKGYSPAPNGSTFIRDNDRTSTLNVGATLAIDPTVSAGSYNLEYTVEINYQ